MPTAAMEELSDELALGYLQTYFARDASGTPRYSGSQFDTLAGGGNGDTANRLTADDLVAVSTLAVHVPATAALSLLGQDVERVSTLLGEIDPDSQLHTLDQSAFTQSLGPDGPAAQLWKLLRRHGGERWGVGPTTASKLMARKRPDLIPVYDSVVAETVDLPHSGNQWVMWWEALRQDDGALAARLTRLRIESGHEHLSLLRVLDIVLWMHGRGPRRTRESVGEDE